MAHHEIFPHLVFWWCWSRELSEIGVQLNSPGRCEGQSVMLVTSFPYFTFIVSSQEKGHDTFAVSLPSKGKYPPPPRCNSGSRSPHYRGQAFGPASLSWWTHMYSPSCRGYSEKWLTFFHISVSMAFAPLNSLMVIHFFVMKGLRTATQL